MLRDIDADVGGCYEIGVSLQISLITVS